MAKQNFLKDAQLNALRGTAFTAPTGYRVALWRATAGEVAGGSYARVTYGAAAGDWTAPANGPGGSLQRQITNTAVLTFPTPTADWSTAGDPVNEVRVFDQGGTNLLYRMQTDGAGNAISKII